MRDNLKLEGREKVVQKMSREGLVEENLADKSTKRVSSRAADADFSLLREKESEGTLTEGTSRSKRLQRRYAAKTRAEADTRVPEMADASYETEASMQSETAPDSDRGYESGEIKQAEVPAGRAEAGEVQESGKRSNPQSRMYQKSARSGNRYSESVRTERGAASERLSSGGRTEAVGIDASKPEKAAGSASNPQSRKYQRLKKESDIANEKLEAAKEKLPTKTKRKKSHVYEDAEKKTKPRLRFDDEPVIKPEKQGVLVKAGDTSKSAAGKTVKGAVTGAEAAVHGKIHETEGDNVGIEAAHNTEIAVESGAKTTISHVKSKVKEAPHERISRLEHKAERANTKLLFERSLDENPEIKKSKIRKMQQKRGIKQRYAAAYKATGNGAAAMAKTGTAAMPKEPFAKRLGNGIKNFARKNKGGIAVLGVCGLAAVLMISAFGTMGSMISEAGGAIVESTYLASDDEIHAADEFYTGLENDLQRQIDRIERDYPGYDEYRYQVDEIGHNPYQLTSYLTAKYGNYKASQVKDELREIFEEQYGLAVHGETVTETVTRTVRVGESLGSVVTSGYCNCPICCGQWSGGPTASGVYPTANHTIAVDAYNPFLPMGTHVIMNGTEYVVEDTGNFARYGVQFDVYYDNHAIAQNHGHQTWEAYLADSNGSNEIEVTETRTIRRLNISMTSHNLDLILRNRLTEDQQKLYSIYNASYGNRDYLFPVERLQVADGMSYDIPPEALSDVRFRNMITEAEKYLGYPYVWGGASPETSFDCSGFVSWVINHCGNGWNYGRLTAEGLRNVCTYVSPSEAKPGDLIFFQGTYDTSGASHVAIYVGNGMMIHCGNPIQYASIETNYWQQHFYCFGRLP